MTVKLISLENSTKKQRDQLSIITADREVMQWIGNGSLWTREKIEQLFDWAKEDAKLGKCERANWCWLIQIDAPDHSKHSFMNVVGFTSLRPTGYPSFTDGPQVRQFISRDHQRRGYASAAFREVLREMTAYVCPHMRFIYAFINPKNGPSLANYAKLGFTEVGCSACSARGAHASHDLLVFRYNL